MKLSKWSKPVIVGTTLMLLLTLLSGCSGSKAQDNEKKVLRVGVLYGGSDESYIRQQYTDAYELAHPNVQIEIVPAINQDELRYANNMQNYKQPDFLESMKKIMTGSNPVDVVVSESNVMRSLTQENLLKQLDPLVQEDKYDLSDVVPSVIDGLKDLGDGNLYGLAPTFTSSALYYNKNLFKSAGVEPPHDGMTWNEIFDLASRVSKGEGKDRTYGITFSPEKGSDPYSDGMLRYVNPLQLHAFDDKAEKMSAATPEWEKAWSTISKLVKNQVIPGNQQEQESETNYDPIAQDMFLSGKTAMTINYSGYVNDLINANNNAGKIKNFKLVDWDIVSVPTFPEKPGVGDGLYLYSIFSINASAPNPETAWDFIKTQNSEEYAKIKSRNSMEIVSRKTYIKPKYDKDYNVAAFYAVKPATPPSLAYSKLYNDKPGLRSLNSIGQKYYQEVLDNKKTPAEALKEWERKGNEMLQAIKNNPKTMFKEDGTPYIPPAGSNPVNYGG